MDKKRLEASMLKVGQLVVGLEVKQRHVFLEDFEAEHLQKQFCCFFGNGAVFGLRAHDENMISHLIVIGEEEGISQGIVEERLCVQLIQYFDQMYQKVL